MKEISKIRSIKKILSANDVGQTGGHQSGILVPKREEILSFFPTLDRSMKNPRFLLAFFDDTDDRWEFSFIYYNNAFFGGTRNEYRLTRMTKFIKENNLRVGDEIILEKENGGYKRIFCKRNLQTKGTKLKLSGEWKVIQI